MKKMQQAQPQFTTDADGQQLAHVALANNQQRATLYAEDYAWLIGEGWSPYWSLTNTGGRHDYVLATARGPRNNPRTVTVARLIAQAAKGRRVTYADGDRTNLRRDNLRIVKGGGLTKAHAHTLRPYKGAGAPPTVQLVGIVTRSAWMGCRGSRGAREGSQPRHVLPKISVAPSNRR